MPHADIVFLTALGLEYDALHHQLVDPTPHIDSDGTRYAVGDLPGGGRRAALALIGEGNLAAAVLTGRAIQEFRPAAVILVGVAGGLSDDAAVGDVVVATRIHTYQGGREETDTFRPRPRSWPVPHGLEQAARAAAQSGAWMADLPDAIGTATPRVHFKPIVSGDVVLDSRTSPLAGLIARYYSDAIAIDMESAGVAEAAHRKGFHQAITVRGISDAADGRKRHTDAAGWQQRAAAHAAAFAITLARRIGPPETATAVSPGVRDDSLVRAAASPPSRTRSRLRGLIRRGRPAWVLSAILVAAISLAGYAVVTTAFRDRGGSGEPGAGATTGTVDRTEPGGWTTVRTASDVTLDVWHMIDLETGKTVVSGQDTGYNPPGMDLFLTHEATRLRWWIAVLDTTGAHTVDRCLATTELYEESINDGLSELLTRGRDICVRTDEDGLAMVTIDQAPSPVFENMTFHYTVWKLG